MIVVLGIFFYRFNNILTFDYYILSLIIFSVFYYYLDYSFLNRNSVIYQYFYIRVLQKIIVFTVILISLLFFILFLDIEAFIDYYPQPNYFAGEDGVVDGNAALDSTKNLSAETNTSENKKLVNIEQSSSTEGKGKKTYDVSLDKEMTDRAMGHIFEAGKTVASKIPSNWGAYSAAGIIGSAAVNATSGMPIVPRAATVAALTLAGSAAGVVGVELGSEAANNLRILTEKTTTNNPDSDSIPSPNPEFGPASPLENGDLNSPLENLLAYSYLLDVIIIVLIITLLWLIFNRFILSANYTFIVSIIDKYSSNRFGAWLKKKLAIGNTYNNRFLLIMFIINIILLSYVLYLHISLTSELIVNIDQYVEVYNYLHNKK
jgi:hypothetical protein